MLFLGLLATGICLADDVNLRLGPWEFLNQWQGHIVSVQLRTNIVNLNKVRLLSIQNDGLVIKCENALNIEERMKVRFVPYGNILTVNLIQ